MPRIFPNYLPHTFTYTLCQGYSLLYILLTHTLCKGYIHSLPHTLCNEYFPLYNTHCVDHLTYIIWEDIPPLDSCANCTLLI